jgi:hypothetical protein
MNNNNQKAPIFRGRRPDLAYFDLLPADTRRALANAAFDWASGAFYSCWWRGLRGFKTGHDIAARVREWNRGQILKDHMDADDV